MSFDRTKVQKAYRVLAGKPIGDVAAKQELQLLGSREELLASLIAVKEVFRNSPELRRLLSEVAAQRYASPISTHIEAEDAALRATANLEVTAAFSSLIEGEKTRSAISNRAHESLQKMGHLSHRSELAREFQWRVDVERR